ncbi:unnamed protein product [Hermetia illucens]|uniref:Fibronectin type-III domain-containing protein n=1 Tax=Hermetia illucens TaxID=343691 RepID=A0A7R8UZK6_HERIL|nr:protein artichoke [Hermetia illucens]XP_037921430.1 protein artichoke [Hermetia illucens]CAD7090064.1 unnamed protein product [Hermetia illucens]
MIVWDPTNGPREPKYSSGPYQWLRTSFLISCLLLPTTTSMEKSFDVNRNRIDKSKFHESLQPGHQQQNTKAGAVGAVAGAAAESNIQCPSFSDSSACPCYKFEDGLFLECPGTTSVSLRTTLQTISSPIQSLSIYDFDRSVTSLSQDVFQPGVNIRHLQFSHSHLETLKDNSLKNIRTTLESLSIVNGKLSQIPTKALSGMQKLMALDFDSNEIHDMQDYSFFGLRLVKLNMKGNRLERIPEKAFAGLDDSMAEIDISENRLKAFPMAALKRLAHLRTLKLSLNQISTLYSTSSSSSSSTSGTSINNNIGEGNESSIDRLPSLVFLDLSSNRFEEISDEAFRPFPQLKTLSLYSNQIGTIHRNSFRSLKELMSLDMSHNRIIFLDSGIFEANKRLQTVDISHNHIHSVSGVFANLPQLREVFLSENNILELPSDAFTNSTNIDVIYLESNAIRHVDPNVFNTLANLEQLYMSSNFIPQIPVTMLDKTLMLTSLSLDGNNIQDLEIGMFRKLEHLREIRLHNNRIRRIRKGVFHPLPSLLELHIQKNMIEEIEEASFASLSNLQHVNLQENHLVSIEDVFLSNNRSATRASPSSLLSIQLDANRLSKLHIRAFSGQDNIQIMWLSENQLTRIERSLFKDLKQLERVYLSNNQIKEIEAGAFVTVKQLRFLELSGNRLKSIRKDNFEPLKELEELNLANNFIDFIEGFSFRPLKKLKTLDLSGNPLIQINRDMFQEELLLVSLNLRNCSLRKIDVNSFRGLANLNELNFEDNSLSPGDIQKLDVPSLRTLKLSNNNFSHIGTPGVTLGMFDKLRSLQHLTLANCSLQSLPDQLFSKNTNLVRLDLSDNHLSQMNRNVFNGLNVFKELKVCRNELTDFPYIALYNLTTLEILTLSGNQLSSIDFFKLNGLPNIRNLNLKDNKITSLSGFNSVNLTQLDFIDLSENLLLSLPANFLQHSINLQRVDLSLNRFLQMPSAALSDASLPRLSWLNLTGNPINGIFTVKEEHYPFLKELYICRTNLSILTSKDFEAFQALQHLHLIRNRITRISPGAFLKLSNLLTLDLSINELETVPKERLQGLRLLRTLNVSHNSLKDLEQFSSDLVSLEIFDLSFNQLDRIGKNTFRHLSGLQELYLMGNRMTTVSTDAFKYLRKLQTLDLRKNYFESVPLRALKPLETNIRMLRIEDNPLHCSCDSQELWEWLRDHQKWMSENNSNYLRCEQPGELRGKVFSKMEPQQFCDAPLILKLAIQDIQPYSVVVSWQSREHSGLNGYEIVYHSLDGVDEVRGKRLNGSINSAKLLKLASNTKYLICVLGLGNWVTLKGMTAINQLNINYSLSVLNDVGDNINNNILPEGLQEMLTDTSTSRCTEVTTLDVPSQMPDENGLSSEGFIHSILTRRLGLIVGCCLGIIVFIVLVSVLGYLKLKKQRIENSKRQHQPMPPDYISYRHFSIPGEAEPNRNVITTGMTGVIGSNSVLPTIVGNSHDSNHITHTQSYMSGVVLGTTTLSTC